MAEISCGESRKAALRLQQVHGSLLTHRMGVESFNNRNQLCFCAGCARALQAIFSPSSWSPFHLHLGSRPLHGAKTQQHGLRRYVKGQNSSRCAVREITTITPLFHRLRRQFGDELDIRVFLLVVCPLQHFVLALNPQTSKAQVCDSRHRVQAASPQLLVDTHPEHANIPPSGADRASLHLPFPPVLAYMISTTSQHTIIKHTFSPALQIPIHQRIRRQMSSQ